MDIVAMIGTEMTIIAMTDIEMALVSVIESEVTIRAMADNDMTIIAVTDIEVTNIAMTDTDVAIVATVDIEMAIIANEYGLGVTQPGMEGPVATKVEEALDLFDFDGYGDEGRVDYILGAKQFGGGVWVIGKCENTFQQGYMDYYKVANKHPYYLFFRPYHLCHLETPRAVALAALYGKAVCTQRMGRVTDCFAFAKTDLAPGTKVTHAIGSDQVYGLVDMAKKADAAGQVPQGVLDVEGSDLRPIIKRALKKDDPITWDDVDLPDTRMARLWEEQKPLL
jgi:predicted homoserine dehydrogenase-like protein